jgi:PKD repeat protein
MQILSTLNKNKSLITAVFSLSLGVLAIVLSPIKVEAAQPISCPLRGGSGDILVNFYSGEKLYGTPTKGDVYRDYTANIPAGEYKVIMTTYDDHSGHGGQGQLKEQVYVALRNRTGATTEGIVAKTGASKDIPENADSITSTLSNSLKVSTATRVLTVVHAAYPGGAESVVPICVLFEKLGSDEPASINGVCGSADGDIVDSLPTGSAACRVGTYSSGPTDTDEEYLWNCVGSRGGTVDNCSAYREQEEEEDIEVTCRVSDTSVMVGDSVTWTGSATGGTGGFTYTWSGAVTGTGTTRTRTFTADGSYIATVTARDNSGNTASRTCSSVSVDEEEHPNVNVTCSVSDTSIEVGDSVTFTANISGGESPFQYEWDGDIEDEDDDNRTLNVQYDDEGVYYVTISIEDANGNTDSANCSAVRVEEEDEEEDLNIACIVSDRSVEVGDEVRFTVDIDGGNGPFEYEWDGDIEDEDDDTSVLRVEYEDEGTYHVDITVTDDDGNSDTASCSSVSVDEEDDEEDFEVTCRVSDTSVEVGDEVRFTVDIDGGNGPFEYEWDGDIEDEDDDTKTLRVKYDDDGRYEVEITVTDDDGNDASDECSIVRVKDDDNNNRSVRVRTDDTPTGQLASLDSVFLNQVPSTGIDDARKIALFVSLLTVWSMIAGVFFYKRHQKNLRSSEIAQFKELNKNR